MNPDPTSEAEQFNRRLGALVLEVMFGAVPDPVVARGLMRLFNMLILPDQLFGDTEFISRAFALLNNPDGFAPSTAPVGVKRDTLLSALAA